MAELPLAQRQAYDAWWAAYRAWETGTGPKPPDQPPIVRRLDTLSAIYQQCQAGSAQCATMKATAAFRDQFPLAIGWAKDAQVNLERGELYPTVAVYQAMQRWLACEQGKIVSCPPGSQPPPAGVLRPGELSGGGAAAAAGAPAPKEGVVLPATATPIPAAPPTAGGVPWWIWPTAVGIGLVVVLLAVGRRKAA